MMGGFNIGSAVDRYHPFDQLVERRGLRLESASRCQWISLKVWLYLKRPAAPGIHFGKPQGLANSTC